VVVVHLREHHKEEENTQKREKEKHKRKHKVRKHQPIKPSSHQAIKPSSHQAIKPSSHQAINPSITNPPPLTCMCTQTVAVNEKGSQDMQVGGMHHTVFTAHAVFFSHSGGKDS
jgi:hypothetical protein